MLELCKHTAKSYLLRIAPALNRSNIMYAYMYAHANVEFKHEIHALQIFVFLIH